MSRFDVLQNKSILLVEDDPITLEMISFGLKEHFELYVAKDGLEGFEIFKKHNVDMILTDIHMPNLNGLEMIKLILQIKPNQNFIVMTSYDSDKNLLDSIKCGALNFIPKPLDIPTLQRFLLLSLTNLKDELKQISPRVSVNFINEAIFLDNKPIF
ncbi:response regulator transcription factor [Campylobacter sputorum]|uniref:response regulator transcription factor n=1 Tax=Campylobacter sputorum TaxID=206 RepID=UPI000B789587|nr:response regulator [Campylobacter sputorum]